MEIKLINTSRGEARAVLFNKRVYNKEIGLCVQHELPVRIHIDGKGYEEYESLIAKLQNQYFKIKNIEFTSNETWPTTIWVLQIDANGHHYFAAINTGVFLDPKQPAPWPLNITHPSLETINLYTSWIINMRGKEEITLKFEKQ